MKNDDLIYCCNCGNFNSQCLTNCKVCGLDIITPIELKQPKIEVPMIPNFRSYEDIIINDKSTKNMIKLSELF